jgi:hypothetical protein
MPFPAEKDDGDLDAFLNVSAYRTIDAGIQDTLVAFGEARARGIDLNSLFLKVRQ